MDNRNGSNGGHRPSPLLGNGDSEDRRHSQFVAALDRLPENCWESDTMMNDLESLLKWDRSEIELYAYRYMAALVEIEQEDRAKSTKYSSQATTSKATGWSPEEVRLLQTLLATFSDVEGRAKQNVAMRLARFFPQKTFSEIEQQVESLHRSHNK